MAFFLILVIVLGFSLGHLEDFVSAHWENDILISFFNSDCISVWETIWRSYGKQKC